MSCSANARYEPPRQKIFSRVTRPKVLDFSSRYEDAISRASSIRSLDFVWFNQSVLACCSTFPQSNLSAATAVRNIRPVSISSETLRKCITLQIISIAPAFYSGMGTSLVPLLRSPRCRSSRKCGPNLLRKTLEAFATGKDDTRSCVYSGPSIRLTSPSSAMITVEVKDRSPRVAGMFQSYSTGTRNLRFGVVVGE
jgi:hypothetical protein